MSFLVLVPTAERRRKAEREAFYESPTYTAGLARLRANLRRLRKQRDLTQEQAAERCGMLHANYQPIESGKINVTLVTLARLADGFGVELHELLAPSRRGT